MGGSENAKRIAYQAAAIAVALGVAWFFISNTLANLEERRIASGFGFLGREAGFEIGESAFLRYGASDSYLRALVVGLTNTLAVALIGIVLATGLGTLIGLCRLSRNPLLSGLSSTYIEFVRNVPLLVQLFFWYAVIAEALPPAREALQPFPGVFVSSRGFFVPVPHFTSEGMTWDAPILSGFNFVGGAVREERRFADLETRLAAEEGKPARDVARGEVVERVGDEIPGDRGE